LWTDRPLPRKIRACRSNFRHFLLTYLLNLRFLVRDLLPQGLDLLADRQQTGLAQGARPVQLPSLLAQSSDLVLLLPLECFQPRLSLAGTPHAIGLERCLSSTVSELVEETWHLSPPRVV
jgi:hypothetical protein